MSRMLHPVSGKLPPKKISPWLGLGLDLTLRLGGGVPIIVEPMKIFDRLLLSFNKRFY